MTETDSSFLNTDGSHAKIKIQIHHSISEFLPFHTTHSPKLLHQSQKMQTLESKMLLHVAIELADNKDRYKIGALYIIYIK